MSNKNCVRDAFLKNTYFIRNFDLFLINIKCQGRCSCSANLRMTFVMISLNCKFIKKNSNNTPDRLTTLIKKVCLYAM